MTLQRRLLVFAAFAGVLVASSAFAQTPDNVLETVQSSIIGQARSWETMLLQHATRLFWLLAGIEVGISAIWLALNGATLESWFAELVRRILFIGFFLFVLTNGPMLVKAIVESLFQIGAKTGNFSPASIFDAGIAVADKLTEAVTSHNPLNIGKNIIVSLCGLVVIIAFGFMAAIMLSVMLEIYIGLLVGMLLLGFGGSSHTKDFVIKYLTYAFSVGMKSMALVMIAAIGSDVLLDIANNPNIGQRFVGPISIAGLAVIIAIISQTIPSMIQGLVQGVSVSSGGEVMGGARQMAGMASGGMGMAMGAAGMALGAGAIAQGASAVSAQARAGGASRGMAAMAGLRAGAGAVGTAAAEKLMGAPGARMGSTLGLANDKIRRGSGNGQS